MKRVLKFIVWLAVAFAGAGALGAIALHRGEPLNATWFVVAAACCYLVAYRLYSSFIAARLLALDDKRATPAEIHDDGRDFVPTTNGFSSGIISRRLPGRDLLSDQRLQRNSVTCRVRSG